MCGICGMAGAPDAAGVREMSAALRHRGPDSEGTAVDGPVPLAAPRLALIHPAHRDQPPPTEDGAVTIGQNGEIYKHDALRARPGGRGHRFATRCDTEAIGHLYEEQGVEAFARLRGMFAVALWDRRARRLVLARDRFGIKPLFHARLRDGSLAFASELRALALAPGFPRELDPDALTAYLAFNSIPGPLTAYKAARKLLPGPGLTGDAETGDTATGRFARPAPAAQVRRDKPEALAAEARDRLRDSVRAHLVSDV